MANHHPLTNAPPPPNPQTRHPYFELVRDPATAAEVGLARQLARVLSDHYRTVGRVRSVTRLFGEASAARP